jgi:hypothetical protein
VLIQTDFVVEFHRELLKRRHFRFVNDLMGGLKDEERVLE